MMTDGMAAGFGHYEFIPAGGRPKWMWIKTEVSPPRSIIGLCHREERSDVATSMTEPTFMGVATSLRSSR
jgi:hypothetical protein